MREVGGGEGVVDALGVGGERGGRRVGLDGGDGGGVAGGDELGGERGPAVERDEVVGEAGADGVAGLHAVAGQAEVFAEVAGGLRQQPGAADVGDQPDAAFGHGDAGGFAGDAVAAVGRHADAAAHDEALHQRDVGFGVAGDAGVHPVFLGPEAAGVDEVALAAAGVELGDVAAGAEGAVAFGVDRGRARRRGSSAQAARAASMARAMS